MPIGMAKVASGKLDALGVVSRDEDGMLVDGDANEDPDFDSDEA